MRDSQVEDAFMTVSGDFGTIYSGPTDRHGNGRPSRHGAS